MRASTHGAVAEDLGAPARKRQRLNSSESDRLNNHQGIAASSSSKVLEPAAPRSKSTFNRETLSEDATVCFGMILDCPATALLNTVVRPSSVHQTVRFAPPQALRDRDNDCLIAKTDERTGIVLSTLQDDKELRLQLTLSVSQVSGQPTVKQAGNPAQFLGIILYGPRNRLDDVDAFVRQCRFKLNDPFRCDENVPYMNPQRLSTTYRPLQMTYDLPDFQHESTTAFAGSASNVLEGFETTDLLQEATDPHGLCTALQPHQRQALTFFHRREQGKHPTEDGMGWLRPNVGDNGSEQACPTPRPVWRGGLLADEMGLGKTLSMLALIATDSRQRNDPLVTSDIHVTKQVFSTLIIVPLSLLSEWETQVRRHFRTGELTWTTHHGKSLFQILPGTPPPDVVFTTYRMIEQERKKHELKGGSLFSYHWRRIILDEAHIVRNHTTSTARAVGALNANSRWAISGTPIQNSLTDFLGLFKFLRLAPYDDAKTFDDEISGLWRNRSADAAAESFKRFLSCIMIRRTKRILVLPKREDTIIRIPFNEDEKEYYRRIEKPVVDLLNPRESEGGNSEASWMTTLQQINMLRLVCVLGSSVSPQQHHPMPIENYNQLALTTRRCSLEAQMCMQCFLPLEYSPSSSPSVYYSSCSLLFCFECSNFLQDRSPERCVCTKGGDPCTLRALVTSVPSPSLTPSDDSYLSSVDTDDAPQISSKVRALISQINRFPNEKHVVFSSWTASLDMIERGLHGHMSNGAQYVRIDGKVPVKKRGPILSRFQNNLNVRIILLTISCGACGLNLTAASRVHLLEPQWNPSLEDQAMARAHRLGQTRPVTTIRYVMENSFEEHVLKVQDRKKLLATAVLSNHSSVERLRELFAEHN